MNKYDDDNWKENDLRKIDYAIGLTINRKWKKLLMYKNRVGWQIALDDNTIPRDIDYRWHVQYQVGEEIGKRTKERGKRGAGSSSAENLEL